MKQSPLPFFLLGLVALAAFLIVGLPTQIQTSESFFSGIASVTLSPDFAIYTQPVDYFNGHMTASTAMADVPAWGAEIFTLGFVIAFEVLQAAFHKSNPTLAKWFRSFTYGVIFFNALTDFLFAPQATLAARIGFMIFISAVVFFCGGGSLALFEHGFHVAHGSSHSSSSSAAPKP